MIPICLLSVEKWTLERVEKKLDFVTKLGRTHPQMTHLDHLGHSERVLGDVALALLADGPARLGVFCFERALLFLSHLFFVLSILFLYQLGRATRTSGHSYSRISYSHIPYPHIRIHNLLMSRETNASILGN